MGKDFEFTKWSITLASIAIDDEHNGLSRLTKEGCRETMYDDKHSKDKKYEESSHN